LIVSSEAKPTSARIPTSALHGPTGRWRSRVEGKGEGERGGVISAAKHFLLAASDGLTMVEIIRVD